MVKLHGVVEGMSKRLFGVIPVEEEETEPSEEFFCLLARLPKGTRVGVETQPLKIREEVEAHFLECIKKVDPDARGGYKYWDSYWEPVINVCRETGHELVYLESKEAWRRHNEAQAELLKAERALQGVSRKSYQKQLEIAEARKAAVLRARKIHEIDRADAILQAIKEGNVELAVCALGHADYWMSQREAIQKSQGIDFEQYTTDIPDYHAILPRTLFTPNAQPNPKVAFERESLLRALRLLETGRIMPDKTPDFVGTWTWPEASRGYFEMFIRSRFDNRHVSGTIEDCLGTAEFRGELTPQAFTFVKSYREPCSQEAVTDPIRYELKKSGNGYMGNYWLDGFGGPAFVQQAPQVPVLELGMNYHKALDRADKAEKKKKAAEGKTGGVDVPF